MTPGPLRRLLGLARRAVADPTDDARLLARYAAGGDADAFELLVWRHAALVLGVCRRVLADEHAAEDAFQATFLALARQARSIRGCVPAWLHRVARRVAVRARRGLRFAPAGTGQAFDASQRARNVHVVDDPSTSASHRELCHILDEELDRLPERFRRVVVLCYLEGTSTAEAARRLGCPRGTVLSRLATAREKLRVRLTRRGIAPAAAGLSAVAATADAPAALVAPAVRAAVAGAAAPRVIDLCDGVLRAMMLSKLKLTAAVVLTVGLVGGGAGWVTLTPGGPGVALADGPPAKPASKPDDQKAAEEHVNRLRNELEKAEVEMADREQRWMHDRAELRRKVIGWEERLRSLEREHALERDLLAARLRATEQRAADARVHLKEMKNQHGPDSPLVKTALATVREMDESIQLGKEGYKDCEGKQTEVMIQSRRQSTDADDQLLLHDRLVALRRQHLQGRRDALLAQVLQHRGMSARPDASTDRLAEMDRKLDDLKREFIELRRELKK